MAASQTAIKPQIKKALDDIYKSPELLGSLLGYKYITKIHGDWIKYIFTAQRDNTLMAHRGSYKTSAVVIGIIWCLLFWPDTTILLASSTHENAKKILSEVKQQYNKDNLIELYSYMGIKQIKNTEWWTKESFSVSTRKKINKEGNVECIGVGGTVTSRHYDKIVCDDIVTIKDRVSQAERDKKKNWIQELQSIINPDGSITFVGTPWHKDDIYSVVPEALKYPLGSLPIEGLTKDRIKDIKRGQSNSFFAAQYELKHIADEDRLFDEPIYKEPCFDLQYVVGYYDCAISDKKSDYNALCFGRTMGKDIYLESGDIWRAKLLDSYDRVERVCKSKNVRQLYVESNGSQMAIAIELRKRGLPVTPVHSVQNKHLRIENLQKDWDRIFWMTGVTPEFIDQVIDYNIYAEHDDAPDALAGLVKAIGSQGTKLSTKDIGRGRKKASE